MNASPSIDSPAHATDLSAFPPFDLARLLRTVFDPRPGERVAILIDLPNLDLMRDHAYLKDPSLPIQRMAYQVFYEGLKRGVLREFELEGGDIYAYEATGGSNLDLPDEARDASGHVLSMERDIYPLYDLILCVSTYSATAPLTAFAHRYGFRGATLHGLNEIILRSGLAVDYFEVSRKAEKMRAGMTRADWVEIDFAVAEHRCTLRLELGGQEAQKSHGLCREGPDVANLPAGEIYYVPTGASGQFPMRYEDGTLALMRVADGRVQEIELLRGDPAIVEAHRRRIASDPLTGALGELGFGTQVLPVSGRDIQDEKILGTLHVATGRSDHLGGDLTPDRFEDRRNATHDDILFSPSKTPEISVPEVRIHRGGETGVLLRDFSPGPYLLPLLEP